MPTRKEFEQSLRNALKASGISTRFRHREELDDETVIKNIKKIQSNLVTFKTLISVYDKVDELRDSLAYVEGRDRIRIEETIESMISVIENIRTGNFIYGEDMSPDKVLEDFIVRVNNVLKSNEVKRLTDTHCTYPDCTAMSELKKWMELEAKYKYSYLNLMGHEINYRKMIMRTFNEPETIQEFKTNIYFFIKEQSEVAENIISSYDIDINSIIKFLKDNGDETVISKIKLIEEIVTGTFLYGPDINCHEFINEKVIELIDILYNIKKAKQKVTKGNGVFHDIKVTLKEQFKDADTIPDAVSLILSREKVQEIINS